MKPVEYYTVGIKVCLKQLWEFIKLYHKWCVDFWVIYEQAIMKEKFDEIAKKY